jgi:gluconate kinase
VLLHGSRTLIAKRLAERKHRYMPASLLDSQFATLEPPVAAIDIDVSGKPEDAVEAIVAAVQR